MCSYINMVSGLSAGHGQMRHLQVRHMCSKGTHQRSRGLVLLYISVSPYHSAPLAAHAA